MCVEHICNTATSHDITHRTTLYHKTSHDAHHIHCITHITFQHIKLNCIVSQDLTTQSFAHTSHDPDTPHHIITWHRIIHMTSCRTSSPRNIVRDIALRHNIASHSNTSHHVPSHGIANLCVASYHMQSITHLYIFRHILHRMTPPPRHILRYHIHA